MPTGMEDARGGAAADWRFPSALLLLLVLAAALRCPLAGRRSLDHDQLWHLALSTGHGSPQLSWPRDRVIRDAPSITGLVGACEWWRPWFAMEHVPYPPLYPMALRIWREAFGAGDRVAEGYSILWSLVAVAAVGLAGARLFDPWTGLAAASLCAVAPAEVLFAPEIRSYTMNAGLGAIVLCLLAGVERDGASPGRTAAIGVVALAMLLTHYFAAGFLAGAFAWAAWRLRGSVRRRLLAAMIAAGVAFAILWGPSVLRQLPEVNPMTKAFALDANPSSWTTLLRMLGLPVRLVIGGTPSTMGWEAFFGSFLVALPVFLFGRRPGLALPWACLIGVASMLAFLDLLRGTRQLAILRYAFVAAPAATLLVAGLLPADLKSPRWRGCGAVATLLAAAVVGTILFRFPRIGRAERDLRQVPEALAAGLRPGQPLLVFRGEGTWWYDQTLLLAASRGEGVFPRTLVRLNRPGRADLSELAGAEAWLLTGPLRLDPAVLVPGAVVLERRRLSDGATPVAELFRLKLLPARSALAPARPD